MIKRKANWPKDNRRLLCYLYFTRKWNGTRESTLFVDWIWCSVHLLATALMKEMQFQMHGPICSILIDDHETSCRCRITVDCFTRSQLPALSTIRSNDFANKYTSHLDKRDEMKTICSLDTWAKVIKFDKADSPLSLITLSSLVSSVR